MVSFRAAADHWTGGDAGTCKLLKCFAHGLSALDRWVSKACYSAQRTAYLAQFNEYWFAQRGWPSAQTEVLNFGASTVEMSMQIGERLSTLSLQDAEATTEEDSLPAFACSICFGRAVMQTHVSIPVLGQEHDHTAGAEARLTAEEFYPFFALVLAAASGPALFNALHRSQNIVT